MDQPRDLTPEELLRMRLAPSDGPTPGGTLGLNHALGSQVARETGAALPPETDPYRPEKPEERSGEIIAAECASTSVIDQSEAANPDRAAARDELVNTGNAAALVALQVEALEELRVLFTEMAAAGFTVQFALQPAAVGDIAGG